MGRTVAKAPIVSLKWNGSTYATTLTDENGVLSKYKVISDNGDVQVSQNGNQLTLTTTNPNADITLRLSKQGTTGGNTLYWVSQKQDVVTGGQDDPVHAYLRVKIESVGNVNLIKKSVTGEVIPNTKFRVVGNGVDTTVTTGANGEILVPNLVAGTYEVREVSVPSPYILDTTPKMVEIKPNTTATVEFINDVAKGYFKLQKVDNETGLAKPQGSASLENAVYEVCDNQGVVVDTLKTDKNGEVVKDFVTTGEVVVIEGLEHGTYTLHEVSAPEGYELAEDIIFTVTDENGDLVIEMVDKKIKPTTGFEQNTLMFGGIALVIVGSLVATKKRKRNN